MAIARFIIQVCGWAIGIPLEILVIVAMLRGGYRKYPVVFLFLLVNFVTTLVDIPVGAQSFYAHNAAVTREAAMVYWMNEWILQGLIFALVISLIDMAISVSRWRRAMRSLLAIGALLFAGISFWVEYQPPPVSYGVWMTPWTSDLSFCATILDLALWMILIAARGSERGLLLICGALGLQFTAEAIGERIVHLGVPRHSLALALGGSMVAVAGNLLCLYIWWRTFRGVRAPVVAKT